MSMVEVSIVLPVHNEAVRIESFIDRLFYVVQKAPFSYEVICVENGSTDGSYAILMNLARQFPRLSVIRSKKGWGNAVRRGLKEARGNLFCYMVSDGQVDPDYILKLYSLYTKHSVDLVKIWRTSRENTNRLVVSRSYNFIARLLFGFASRDINATPKILSTERMRSLRLRSPNIALDVELLSKLAASGGKWTEIPAPAGEREGGTSTTNFASALEMMIALVRLRFA